MAFDEAIRVRVGRQFLQVDCKGQASLAPCITSGNPGEQYTFHITDVTHVEDLTDGKADLLRVVHLQAVRCGRAYYLCATHDHHNHPYTYRVTCQARVGVEGQWVLTSVPGSRFMLEPWQFRDYCLANVDGELGLRRVSMARHSNKVYFYPIPRHHQRHHQRHHRRQEPSVSYLSPPSPAPSSFIRSLTQLFTRTVSKLSEGTTDQLPSVTASSSETDLVP